MTDKETAEGDVEEAKVSSEFCVVGVGASAGGIEALQKLCAGLNPNSNMAFVIVQHRDPAAEGRLLEVIQRGCQITLHTIKDGLKPQPNCIYLAPNGRFVSIVGGVFRTYPPEPGERLSMPIDFFFRSLAQNLGDKAIGIVLSGSGTDGALGLKAIKSAGGLTIVQDKHQAQYDAMPHNAIATGSVDLVLDAEKIGAELAKYVRHPYVAHSTATAAPLTRTADLMERIFTLLRTHTGHDFSHYKRNTITRRIERRMAVHQINKLGEYLRYMLHTPAEIDALFKELLINVTSFFRDPESFEALTREVLPRLLRAGAKNGPVRIWVPGCSSGEEAYSLAMVLVETADALGIACEAQIFATDIDNASLETARQGIYPESIETDVSKDRLQRFFIRDGSTYRVNKRIRDMVIVAKQDLIRDPPFSKLDLVVCRNLLIYLNPELQKKVLPLFHYTLKPRGILMLGPSETVGEFSHLFSVIDKRWRIFERTHAPRNAIEFPATPLLSGPTAGTRPRAALVAAKTIAHAAEKALLERYAPSCVIVNEKYDIVHFHGRTSRYLEPPTGEPSLNVLKMAREELRIELRTMLHKIFTGQAEQRAAIRLKVDGQHELVNLVVQPFPDSDASRGLVMVAFEQAPRNDTCAAPAAPIQPQLDQRVSDLESELNTTKDSLQTTIEELETSNEELKSTNEELQSTNEELQSTNEELETSKEELQSINEELITVNSELQSKLDELSQINNDVVNLLASTDVATIFLDNALRIKRFTPNVHSIMNLINSDVGRHISDIAPKLIYDDLAKDAEQVLRTLVFRQREVEARLGGWYSMRIMPYRRIDNVIDGVVITFANISEMHKQRQQALAAQQYAEKIIAKLPHPLLVIDQMGKIVSLNHAWLHAFHWPNHDLVGQLVFGLFERSEDISALQEFVESPQAQAHFELGGHGAAPQGAALKVFAQRLTLDTPLVPSGEAEMIVLTVQGP